jgi:hypothetical protein
LFFLTWKPAKHRSRPSRCRWIRTNDFDLLFQLEDKRWSRTPLDLKPMKGASLFVAEIEQIAANAVAFVASDEKAGGVKWPATGLNLRYDDRFPPYCSGFITRNDTKGIDQFAGINTTPRSVKIRYRLVQQPTNHVAETRLRTSTDQVAVEDLALRMLAAIRDKEDDVLRELSVDRIKGWRDALPQFAFEGRERFQHLTGKPFSLWPEESVVEGEVAAVKCTGPKELEGKHLVLFFVKTADGWRNFGLRNSPPETPLKKHLAAFQAELARQQRQGATNTVAMPPKQDVQETPGKPLEPKPAE